MSKMSLEDLRDTFKKAAQHDQDCADKFWEGLSYQDKCNAFHAVVQRIVRGELDERGTYRYVLYDVFGFDVEMYVRGMNCGYLALHNAIVDKDEETKQ